MVDSFGLPLSATRTRSAAATTATAVRDGGASSATGLHTARSGCTFHAVEVGLVLLIELHCAVTLEFVAALDQNGALIRARLTFVEFVAGPDRSWSNGRKRRGRRFLEFSRGRLRKLGLLLPN